MAEIIDAINNETSSSSVSKILSQIAKVFNQKLSSCWKEASRGALEPILRVLDDIHTAEETLTDYRKMDTIRDHRSRTLISCFNTSILTSLRVQAAAAVRCALDVILSEQSSLVNSFETFLRLPLLQGIFEKITSFRRETVRVFFSLVVSTYVENETSADLPNKLHVEKMTSDVIEIISLCKSMKTKLNITLIDRGPLVKAVVVLKLFSEDTTSDERLRDQDKLLPLHERQIWLEEKSRRLKSVSGFSLCCVPVFSRMSKVQIVEDVLQHEVINILPSVEEVLSI